jgi:hypothetical protein
MKLKESGSRRGLSHDYAAHCAYPFSEDNNIYIGYTDLAVGEWHDRLVAFHSQVKLCPGSGPRALAVKSAEDYKVISQT